MNYGIDFNLIEGWLIIIDRLIDYQATLLTHTVKRV